MGPVSWSWLLASTLVVQRPLLLAASSEYQCLDSPKLLETTLVVSASRAGNNTRDFEVPPLPLGDDSFAYALRSAFVVLPWRCVKGLGLEPNVGDLDGALDQWMGRFGDLCVGGPCSSSHLRGKTTSVLRDCTLGWVIFAHGSGGFTYDNPRYTYMMAAAGYGVIAPDSFASAELGLRYKAPVENLPAHLRALNNGSGGGSYWCDNNVYEATSTCPPAMAKSSGGATSYPLCYSSDADVILSDTTSWRQYYERVYQLRQRELDYVVEHLPSWVRESPKLFLAGESEGGMVAARYYHPKLEPLLQAGGRVVLQWGCGWDYYVSCPSNAQIGGGRADVSSTPVLNAISHVDPFFGPTESSVAWKVANAPGGYGARPPSGNCMAQLGAQGIRHGYVVSDVGSEYHGLTETSGNLLRALLFGFLAAPRSPSLLSRLREEGGRGCANESVTDGLRFAECSELGPGETVPGAEMPECAWPDYDYHLEYYLPDEPGPNEPKGDGRAGGAAPWPALLQLKLGEQQTPSGSRGLALVQPALALFLALTDTFGPARGCTGPALHLLAAPGHLAGGYRPAGPGSAGLRGELQVFLRKDKIMNTVCGLLNNTSEHYSVVPSGLCQQGKCTAIIDGVIPDKRYVFNVVAESQRGHKIAYAGIIMRTDYR
ncbi:unnamed protein product, partial [Prorocentrum cordatum]